MTWEKSYDFGSKFCPGLGFMDLLSWKPKQLAEPLGKGGARNSFEALGRHSAGNLNPTAVQSCFLIYKVTAWPVFGPYIRPLTL